MQSRADVKIVAFPCNQFGRQEPGAAQEIRKFAEGYGLKVNTGGAFSLMEKVDVNGANAHPVWAFLKAKAGGGDIKWNFATKFLVRCSGSTCDVTRHDGKLPSQICSKGEL
eukprot:gnl/TRDRNA2_/TRDRNA2_35304_c0_seq1.p2 gnl/TRDRNA2_/TRDRNA2_35304_c0~~gnl/TRDRNA2_/TRDRNA2_35304_c0_seq1.p2  ORF type:complete len:111 (+),score=28.80 gnl/TRDRNA2_/TRDRNA2_35304_c0_seq1:247-579(+)